MAEYIQKPISIQAIQFNGTNEIDVVEFCQGFLQNTYDPNNPSSILIINLLPVAPCTSVSLKKTDFLIKDIDDEFKKMSENLFNLKYELAVE